MIAVVAEPVELEVAIRARHVGKVFRRAATVKGLLQGRLREEEFTALADVSLEVVRGEAFGLMGPNGAGKSTLLRILAGLLVPSRGEAHICGIDTRDAGPELARAIGYMAADDRGLQARLSPRETLAWHGALYGLVRRRALERADALLERVGLTSHALRPVRELSTGMRRRVGLARALIADPPVLILDEPTRGVDPAGAAALHAHLREALAEGRTVVIATHDRHEVGALCRRVAVLERGRLAMCGAPEAAAARALELHLV